MDEERNTNNSFDKAYQSFEGLRDKLHSFSIRDSVKSVRNQINEKLAIIHLKDIEHPKDATEKLIKQNLHAASSYAQDNFPYLSCLSRSHGYLISSALVMSIAFSPLRSTSI